LLLCSVPLVVVTVTKPVFAPLGTIAVRYVLDTTVNSAARPLKRNGGCAVESLSQYLDSIPHVARASDKRHYNSKKRLVGERGFEPPTPWSRIQGPQQEGMRRSESKLHACNRGGPLFTIGDVDRQTLVYTRLYGHGCEGYVTTHVTNSGTAQLEPIRLRPRLRYNVFFPPWFKLPSRGVAFDTRVGSRTKNFKIQIYIWRVSTL
jgi:hypothetical protein